MSLDEELSNFTVFLSHLVTSVRQLFPGACKQTFALTGSSEPHSPQEISLIFLDELTELKSSFVLVLDDYGFIHNQDIHDLCLKLCKFSQQSLQLVLLSRRDPPFPLSSFRAKAELVEIRQVELQYSLMESAAFLEKAANISLDNKSRSFIQDKLEGWPAGLRLIALSLKGRDNVNDFLREMKADTRHLHDYLIAEVLSRQSSSTREGLLKTSILRSFCGPLYEVLSSSDDKKVDTQEYDGQLFIQNIQQSNLFCIALDDRHEWFRYHHLFQDILQHTLFRRYDSDEIEKMLLLASEWSEEQGLLEDAFYYAMKLTNFENGMRFIVRHRLELMNQEKWHILSNWLAHLSDEQIDNHPDLLITKAWICENQKRIPEMLLYLEKAESLIHRMSINTAKSMELKGEIDTMKSGWYYLSGNSSDALEHAQQAIASLPASNSSSLAYAYLVASLSYQMIGEVDRAQRLVYDALRQVNLHSNTYHARLLLTLCMVDWLEGDLLVARQKAVQLLELGRNEKLQESVAFGNYFIGITSYYLNELETAEKHLIAAIDTGFIVDWNTYTHSSFALALTYFYSERPEKANEVVETFIEKALQSNNISRLQLGQAFQAELYLRQGNLKAAQHSINRVKFDQLQQVVRFFTPQLTKVRVLVAQGAGNDQNKLQSMLLEMEKFYRSIHNRRCLIEVLIIQALFTASLGNTTDADELLAEGLSLAESGGFIRLFLDYGPDLEKLLARQDNAFVNVKYLQQLKDAFAATSQMKEKKAADSDGQFAHLLTNRELEILELFAKRLSNQEIADRLFIADNTVKRHSTNIFRKLDVKNRRQAVLKAHQLGIAN